eukprot:CAMPEP_0198700372 /NCGR_PEP_ID=MMETSP1468-20131203/368951_1 /TAXON_ID=1461545 /ORGANISM="Mantoniella sp, Strain CCMP1436" /LENGTH=36 /DNA_ID= /DNA_START= /DNA_END= /DNA_ORIENTATION=
MSGSSSHLKSDVTGRSDSAVAVASASASVIAARIVT